MILVLLKPKLYATRNRWLAGLELRTRRSRDTVILLFGLAVMFMMFAGTKRALAKLVELSPMAYLPPLYPFSFMLMLLFFMLLFSNTAAALGALFHSRELDLVLSSPISNMRFFIGKYLNVFLSSAWMPLIFLLPVVLAFGLSYEAPSAYYVLSLLLLIPFFVITTGVGVLCATLFVVLVPARSIKIVIFLGVCAILAGIYYLVRIADLTAANTSSEISRLFQMLAILSFPQILWLPSHWVASSLQEILEPSGRSLTVRIILLYGTAIGITALAYLLLGSLHEMAYSRVRTQHSKAKRLRRTTWEWVHTPPFFTALYRRYWAVARKELTLFTREITQTIQFVMLVGLYTIYLYKINIFGAAESLPTEGRFFWQGLLFITNAAIGAFVTTAMCTRFVFPSISLEGPSFWALLSAPLRVHDIVRAKFLCWYFPIAFVACLIFAAGARAVSGDFLAIFINGLSGIVISYGIVGLGVGLGAYFADFDWEHPSQLAASFGSLVFMLSATMLIAFTMIPIGLIIFSSPPDIAAGNSALLRWWIFFVANAALVISVNYAAGAWALRAGQEALLSRMR